MGSRLRVIGLGLGLVLGCGGSDRVTLGLLPEGMAGSGGAAVNGAAGATGNGALGGRVREGSPSIEGIDGVGGAGGLDERDGGSAVGGDAGNGSRADADGGAVGNGGAPDGSGVAGGGGAAGVGGAAGESVDADGAAGGTGSGGAAGAGVAGAGDVVVVNLEPSTLGLFVPPIDSSRYVVAGYDAAAGVCVSIIWDYSNNGLALGRHCDDFGQYVSFPYVLVEVGPAPGCVSSWGYVGLSPSAASGCIDPIEGLVNVRLEVEAEGVRYAVRAVNAPALRGP